jgi:uncharacterized protein (TIGR03790 family)
MTVRYGGNVLGTATVSNSAWQDYTYTLPTNATPGGSLDVAYFNATERSTRPLLVQSISVNGILIPVQGIAYDRGSSLAAATDGVNMIPFASVAPTMAAYGALRVALSSGVSNLQMGLVINDADSYSADVGEYYRIKHAIPASNIVHLNFPVADELTATQAASMKQTIDAALPGYVQAIAIAWKEPHHVSCFSITTAITIGSPTNVCSGVVSTVNPFYNNIPAQALPYAASGIRPSMLLAAYTVDQAKAMIDRGVAADRTYPSGSGSVMFTSDSDRRIRAVQFNIDPTLHQLLGHAISPYVDLQLVNGDSIQRPDILFYFQGLSVVPNIGGNNVYLPGAIFDTFTSCSGWIDGGNLACGQDSILDYIKAGATASFGTVVEPLVVYNRFPKPYEVISYYTKGQSLVESYWHGVQEVSFGLFIGDPLANPWMAFSRYIDTKTPVTPILTDMNFPLSSFTLGQTTYVFANITSTQYDTDYPIYDLYEQQLGLVATSVGSDHYVILNFDPLPGGVTSALHHFFVRARYANGQVSGASNILEVNCVAQNQIGSCTGMFGGQPGMPTNVAVSFLNSNFQPGQENVLHVTFTPGANNVLYWVSVSEASAPVGQAYTVTIPELNLNMVPLPVGISSATYKVSVIGWNSDWAASASTPPVSITCTLVKGVGNCI